MILLLVAAMAEEPAIEVDTDLLTRDTAWSLDLFSSSLSVDTVGQTEGPAPFSFATFPSWSWYDRVETTRRTSLLRTNMGMGVSALRSQTGEPVNASFQVFGSFGTEQRLWLGSPDTPVFLGGRAGLSSNHQVNLRPEEDADRSYAVDASASLGTGVGRVLELAPRTRADKLSRILVERGTLSGPLDETTRQRLVAGWYAHRNQIGSLTPLLDTEEVLLASGLLAQPLTTEESYIVRNIIDDARTASRIHGWTVGGWVEGQVTQVDNTLRQGRTATVAPVLRGGYHRLLSEDEGISLQAEHRLEPTWDTEQERVLAGGSHLEVSWYRAFFGRYQDPIGTLGVSASWTAVAALEGDAVYVPSYVQQSQAAQAAAGEIGHSLDLGASWSHQLNRATSFGIRGGLSVQDSQFYDSPRISGSLAASLRFGTERGRLANIGP